MGLFDYRFKLPLHIVELILIVAVCGISTARLFLPGVTTKTRANTIALGFVSWHHRPYMTHVLSQANH